MIKKIGILIALTLFSFSTLAAWEISPSVSLFELYDDPNSNIKDIKTLSWPDGKQAIVTIIEVKAPQYKTLYRCIDYFTKDMHASGDMCLRLVR